MKEQLPIPPQLDGHLWHSTRPRLDQLHRHEELECNLVLRGRGAYLVNGVRVDLQRHDLIWLFPGQSHLMLDQNDRFELLILVIRPGALARICNSAAHPLTAQDPGTPWVRPLLPPQSSRLETVWRDLLEARSDPPRFNSGLGYLVLSAWHHFEQTATLTPTAGAHPAINEMIQLIHSETDADDLERLAAAVGLTPSAASRLFKRQTGVSVTAFRNRCRIARFLDRYEAGHRYTMLDCALAAGFGSYAQFYRVFSRVMGITPSEYRRRHR